MRPLPSLTLVLLLTACAEGGGWQWPEINIPQRWDALFTQPEEGRVQSGEVEAAYPWWQEWNDPVLTELINLAETNNQDIKIATARLREARALRIIASAALYPTVDGAVAASRGNRNNIFSEKPITLYKAGFDARWEIDLFGRASSLEEAAEATISAREAAALDVLHSVRAEVARVYIQLRGLQQQRIALQSAASAQEESWKLTQSLTDAGIKSGLDAAQAETLYRRFLTRVPGLQAQEAEAIGQLAILLGVLPDAVPQAVNIPGSVPTAPPTLVLSQPVAVIAQRPDVLQAERELLAASALEQAAIRAQYPSISLSAFLGLRDTSLAGSGAGWSLGAGLLQPIFNAGQIRAEIEAEGARAEVAAARYEQAVITAMAEVEAAIRAYLYADDARQAATETVQAAQLAVTLAEERYTKGLVSYLDVANAQATQADAAQNKAASEALAAESAVRLWKVLGG